MEAVETVAAALSRFVSVGEVFLPVCAFALACHHLLRWALLPAAARARARAGRRALASGACFAGFVVCYAVKTLLKHLVLWLLRRRLAGASTQWLVRPAGAPDDCDALCLVLNWGCPGPASGALSRAVVGFPSGHTTVVAFFLVVCFLETSGYLHKNGRHGWDCTRLLAALCYTAVGAVAACTRLYRGCHTLPQILAGALLGWLLGYVFFVARERAIAAVCGGVAKKKTR
eukprot:TRINITY_DN4921_c0_g2_i1.p2 TRINITY_DN4921_c0_g2~~TRINITY_DN4921_c0_g2_i1.p2  ORF type:complete len:230 (+),score=56.00 TRINITY_DN4921_c0_g2_i1:299-988(+)